MFCAATTKDWAVNRMGVLYREDQEDADFLPSCQSLPPVDAAWLGQEYGDHGAPADSQTRSSQQPAVQLGLAVRCGRRDKAV
eukprot:2476238-Pyramimonas_sp.AAC.1